MCSTITIRKSIVLSLLIIPILSTNLFAQNTSNKSFKNQKTDSLYFLIPYKIGDKFGLADTLGNIKVKPEYDDIKEFYFRNLTKQAFYYFTQNGKTILTDHNNNKYLQQYDSIDYKNRYLYRNGKIGLYEIVYRYTQTKEKDTVRVLIDPIYDKLENHYPYYLCTLNGKQEIIKYEDYGKTIKVKSMVTNSIISDEYNVTIEKTKKSKLELKQEKINRQLKFIENITRDATKEDLEKVEPIEFTQFDDYIKYKENGLAGILLFYYSGLKPLKLYKIIQVPAKYDFIDKIRQNIYLAKLNNRYGVITHGLGNTMINVTEFIYDEILSFAECRGAFLLLKKDNKYAVYHLGRKKIITDFEYDHYSFIPAGSEDICGFLMLEKDKKKKIVNIYNDVIFENTYDDILVDKVTINLIQKSYYGENSIQQTKDVIKLKSKGKYGIQNSYTSNFEYIEVPCEFDDIICEDLNYYTTVNKGLKGAFLKQRINISPKYSSIKLADVNLYPNMPHFILFEVTDNGGNKFFVNQNGREYYKP